MLGKVTFDDLHLQTLMALFPKLRVIKGLVLRSVYVDLLHNTKYFSHSKPILLLYIDLLINMM